MRILNFTVFLLFISPFCALAQTPVAVGQGSYASEIPAAENVDVDSRPLYVLDGVDEPIPTNDWWTPLILQDMYGDTEYHLWAHPLDFTVNDRGLGFHYATEWSGGQDITKIFVIPPPVVIGGEGFAPSSERVKSWGDWNVAFRLAESASEYVDVTIGHGLPFAWLEYTGVTTAQISTDGERSAFDKDGNAQAFPFTGDHFGFTFQGRDYGVFAPAGTQFSESGGRINARFAGNERYLVVAALPEGGELERFYQHAYALPRDTRVDWSYDEARGKVTTQWSLETEVLQGPDNGVLQGFLPHHLKYTEADFSVTGLEYLSARGPVRLAAGNDFGITYPYNGALSQLPPPQQLGKSGDYDPAVMAAYFEDFATKEPFLGDKNTYTAGKSLSDFARYIANANSLDNPNQEIYEEKLGEALADWFTYTPGEPYSYYAYLPNFKGLLGFEPGFGSQDFNDHHFHYGYHVYAAGVLGLQDPSFIQDYGEMATLIAKEYANWDRNDERFPLFRNFDPWEGHSWANGGYGMNPPIGNNQESSSEAMMSWTGLIQLGLATDNADMLAAGAFGYVTEAAATNEYWFDRDDENLPPGYGPDGKIACIVSGAGVEYQTFFGLNPAYVHGIQYVPVLPSSYYLVQNDQFAAAQREYDFLVERSISGGFGPIGNWGDSDEWDNIALRYASLFNPEYSVNNLGVIDDQNDDPFLAGEDGMTYYTIYANRTIGRRDFDFLIGAANSGVFYNSETEEFTYCAFNPTSSPQQYTVYRNGSSIGSITAPANQFYSTNSLDGDTNPNPDPEPDPGVPSPWTSADIGSVGIEGTAGFANGTFTVEAAGADIWNRADQFHYVYQSLSGDGEITAQVASLTNTNPWAKAGVMIRESLQPNSKHAMTALTAQNGVESVRRTSAGAQATSTRQGGVSAPVRLRLVRSGDTFTSSYSTDGSTWTEIYEVEISMAETVYVGLATTAHTDEVLTTARYTDVSVQEGSGDDGGGPPNPSACENPVNDDFSYAIATTANGATLTFQPARNGVGDNVTILYYGTDESAIFPGYPVAPGEPFAINAPVGTTVYFYYTYSVPEGGERNTINNQQSFVVGACDSPSASREAPVSARLSGAKGRSVFPNPVSRTLNVVGSEQPVEQVVVYDMTGRQRRVPFEQEAGRVRLDTQALPPGVYRVRLQTATEVIDQSFVKQ